MEKLLFFFLLFSLLNSPKANWTLIPIISAVGKASPIFCDWRDRIWKMPLAIMHVISAIYCLETSIFGNRFFMKLRCKVFIFCIRFLVFGEKSLIYYWSGFHCFCFLSACRTCQRRNYRILLWVYLVGSTAWWNDLVFV